MKYMLSTLVLALPFVAGQVSAQEPQEERPRRDGEMRARMIEEFDADGDGELNDEERQTARETMRERRGNRPGRGGQGRGGEGRGRGPGRDGDDRPAPPDPNQLFDRFDENKDGQLSRDEFMKLSEETRGRRGPRGPREGRPGGPRPEEGADQGPPRGEEFSPPPGPRGPEGRGPEGRGPQGRGPGAGGPGGRGPGFGGPDPNRIFDRFDDDGDDRLNRNEFMKLSDWTREMRERFAAGGQRGGRGPRGEGDRPRDGRGRGAERPPRPQRPVEDTAPAGEAAPVEDGST